MTPEIEVYLGVMDTTRRAIRQALEGVDAQGLNWTPLPGEANSLYAIVSHLCAGETFMIHRPLIGQAAGGRPPDPFAARGDNPQEILGRLDEVGNTTRRLLEGLSSEDLSRAIESGGGRPSRTLRQWIINSLHHQALHLGHIEITKQLYQAGILKGQ